MKKLVLELSVSHKNLLDAESEIQELKLKTIAVRKTEDLEAEVENLQIRNKLLLQENQSASNNISELCALNNQLRAQLAERTDVPKVSVATNTAISGPCHCKELTEKVHELKLINVQRNNRIGILELQIKAEEFPYQQKAKELEDSVSYYKNKNMELRTDLRRLHHMIKEKDSSENCDSCRKRKSLKSHHVAVQTDEVKDEYFLMAGGGGSGIIREDQLMKMRIKIYELESKNEMLKELCRERRRRILGLEEKLMAECRPCNIEERGSDSKEFQGVEKQSNGAGPSNDVEPIQSKGFNSGQVSVQAGNKEKSLNIRENLQRPRQNMYNIGYTCNTRRPLKENVERAIDDLGGFSKN
ncbi:hypothetical protein B7P43_G18363 [Cryptotermes secundus]|uniref:Uncharacterized protein n=1 Tax=Cryptotermes secundus TaxID=105785 RepID=A0A2J7PV04_9NEOP|nr:endonuclease MutS2 [Cryptotermes secundus]PNF20166.1 hypothetical protein B7P43_G18363 [Cryptotermes secundus]